MPKTIKSQFYVYVLRDPRPSKNRQPIYVGKGKGGRAREHWRKAEEHYNPILQRVFAKIAKVGLEPQVEIIRHFNIEADAFEFEKELIAKYGRLDLELGTLCNLTNGGDGNGEAFRKLFTDPKFAKAHAERMRKRWADPEQIKAQSEVIRKLNANPNFTKAKGERMRKLHADPEFARLHVERMRKRNSDPAFIKARTEGNRKRLDDPDLAMANTERLRQKNTDPEFQARRIAAHAAYYAKRRAEKEALERKNSPDLVL